MEYQQMEEEEVLLLGDDDGYGDEGQELGDGLQPAGSSVRNVTPASVRAKANETGSTIQTRAAALRLPLDVGMSPDGWSQSAHSGYLIMCPEGSFTWKQYWFHLEGPTLTYYKREGATKEKGRIDITFVSFADMSPQDRERIVDSQFMQSAEKRARIYYPRGSRLVTARTNEEFQEWRQALEAVLDFALTPEEIETKNARAAELEDLWQQHADLLALKAQTLSKELERQGLGVSGSKDVVKQGVLSMINAHHEWQDHYLILKQDFLFYSPVHKHHKEGAINLKMVTIEDDPDNECGFIIRSPMLTYTLKAKHVLAKIDWVSSLSNVQSGAAKKKKKGVRLFRRNKEGDEADLAPELAAQFADVDAPVYTDPVLSFKSGGRKRTLKLRTHKKEYTVGRSSASSLPINDKAVSREHAKVIYVAPCKWVLVDLGSHSGTKVNRERIVTHLLRPNDKLSFGGAKVKFEAKVE